MPIFQVAQSREIAEWLKKGTTAAIKAAVASTALRTVGHIQNELIPNEEPQPVDTGAYRAGWHVDGSDVVNTLPYATVIEGGARGANIKIGHAMIKALKLWVLRKGFFGRGRAVSGATRGIKEGAFGVGKAGRAAANIEQQAESVAWAIAVAMKKRGIFNRNGSKGLRIAERATQFALKVLPEEMAREVGRALR